MKHNGSNVIDDNQAADDLGIAVQTLRNWRSNRRGPSYLKLGRSIRYRREDIEHYKLRNRVDPNSKICAN